MKLLLCSDLHCSTKAARQIVQQAEAVDVVIIAGDLASQRRNLNATLDVLCAIQRPTVLVPGNNESLDELVAGCDGWPAAEVLHGTQTRIADVNFFGLGGGVPVTPFGSWSFDLSEEEAAAQLAACPPACVLISHSPPHGVVDTSSNGQHLGSTAVRDAVEQKRPALVVCGHIHESGGQQAQLGDTPVVNAGPRGMLWEL